MLVYKPHHPRAVRTKGGLSCDRGDLQAWTELPVSGGSDQKDRLGARSNQHIQRNPISLQNQGQTTSSYLTRLWLILKALLSLLR